MPRREEKGKGYGALGLVEIRPIHVVRYISDSDLCLFFRASFLFSRYSPARCNIRIPYASTSSTSFSSSSFSASPFSFPPLSCVLFHPSNPAGRNPLNTRQERFISR